MDYVQRVLARQRRLLSLLLLGREQGTDREEAPGQAVYSSTQAQAAPEQVLAENMAAPVRAREEDMLWRAETASGTAALIPARALSTARFATSGAGSTETVQRAEEVRAENDIRWQTYAGFGAAQNGGKMAEAVCSAVWAVCRGKRAQETAGRALGPFSAAGGAWRRRFRRRPSPWRFSGDAGAMTAAFPCIERRNVHAPGAHAL